MGLDVYLKKCVDWEDSITKIQQAEELVTKVWDGVGKPYNDMTEVELNECREKIDNFYRDMGLGKWGEDYRIEDVRIPSFYKDFESKDHIFELGYFRSSYNEAGINFKAKMFGFPTLYDIFPEAETSEEYYLVVDWGSALSRVNDALEQIVELQKSDISKYDCIEINLVPSLFGEREKISSKKGAIDAVRSIVDNNRPENFRSFSNGDGTFMLDGINVIGLIEGKSSFMGRNTDCVYAVYEVDKTEFDFFQWTIEAYMYVKRTIEFVLDQEDHSQYRLSWSA